MNSSYKKVMAVPSTAAVLIMLLSMFLFTANDAVGKWLTNSYSVGQLVFIRSCAAALVLIPFAMRAGLSRLMDIERPWIFILRIILTLIDSFAFYYAVSFLPLADVMTFWLAAPIYVAALSPMVLGEHVGWRRWAAIAVGFLGVIIALEPSNEMLSPAALVSLAGSLAFGLTMLFTRNLRSTPGIAMIFWQSLGGVAVGAMTIPFSWTNPATTQWPALVLLGILSMVAYVLVNLAFKLADAAIVAPLQYTQLFWAIIFGWLVFGDFPSNAKFAGALLIIASGLFILYRERKLAKSGEKMA